MTPPPSSPAVAAAAVASPVAPSLVAAAATPSLSRRAKPIQIVLLLAGVALLVALVRYSDPEKLLEFTRDLGWRLVPLLLGPAALMHAAFVTGWWLAFPEPRRRPALGSLVKCYLPGEAINALAGLARLGGEPVKAALLRTETGWGLSIASVVSARTLRVIAQFGFMGAGLGTAVALLDLTTLQRTGLVLGTVALTVNLAIFFFLQQRGLLSQGLTFLERLRIKVPRRFHAGAKEVDGALRESYRGRALPGMASIVVQFAGFCTGVLEVLFFCRFLGIPVSIAEAFLVESFALALSTIANLVPAGLGVMEGSRALAFQMLGLGWDAGMMAGLLRRFRELAWAGVGMGVYGLFFVRSSRDQGSSP